MIMRHIFSFIICACSILSVQAQNFEQAIKELLNRRGGSSPIIECINSNLFIVRQQYRLERDGDFYGKNGKTYYGEAYSLGIKVGGGMYFRSNILKPWQGDADYDRVNASNNYNPKLFYCYQRSLQDSVYKKVDLELGSQYSSPRNADSTLYKHQEAVSDFGLVEVESAGKKNGYMVWAYSNTDIQDSAMQVSLRESALSVDANPDSTLLAMNPDKGEQIIGGLYVVPKYERAGRVQFQLAGVAVKGQEGQWFLQMLTSQAADTKKESEDEPKKKRKKEKEIELTPSK